jgi:Predicted membrane protein
MISGRTRSKVPLITSLLRYNVSATAATATDFSVLFISKEFFGLQPWLGTFIGACCGATVAFILGRNWTFLNKEGKISDQGVRFAVVAIGSILLNTFGEYMLTEIYPTGHYMISRVIVAICIGLSYNFPMQRYFVFK